MSEVLLQLKDMSVQYGGAVALERASIAIDEGEIVALMGPNGAGKSTALKSVFGLAPISNGTIEWHEQEVIPLPHEMVRRGISFVPQGRQVFGSLTVRENLEIGGAMVHDKKMISEHMKEVLDIFPALTGRMNTKAGVLSGGQQQMLALARGLMTDPKVLLLDEPSLGLAPKIVKEVFAKIREINERHKTAILVVEHNIKSLLDVAHRAYVLDKGKIVADEPATKLKESNILERVFLGKLA